MAPASISCSVADVTYLAVCSGVEISQRNRGAQDPLQSALHLSPRRAFLLHRLMPFLVAGTVLQIDLPRLQTIDWRDGVVVAAVPLLEQRSVLMTVIAGNDCP